VVASTFQELSLEAAKNFLHTVVVVDDEAYLDRTEISNPRPTTTPGRKKNAVARNSEDPGHVKNSLDAKQLIDKFASEGLICGVIKPSSKREGIKTKVDKATQRADVVILDWKINDTYGDRTLEIIETILSSDSQDKDRLRLIAIYTGEQDLLEISSQVENLIKEIYGSVVVSNNRFMIDAGPTRIVLFSKSEQGLTDELVSRVVPIKELPERIIFEFSLLYSGLLNNTALAAIGEIRAITHRILGKFSKDLDVAYLNHRALSNPCDEAEYHVVPLISSEIQDALEGRDVNRFLSQKSVELWLKNLDLEPSALAKRMGDGVPENKAVERLKLALQKGVVGSVKAEEETHTDKWASNLRKLSKGNAPTIRGYITDCLSENEADALKANQYFSILTSIRTRYETPPPQLKLGAIITDGIDENKTYFLCVQPLCDSVRLPKDGRDFVFLRMKKHDSPDVVVKERSGDIRNLKIDYSPYQSVHYRLKPKLSVGVVVAKQKDDFWFFQNTSRKKLYWVADLKMAHAQRIANQYATQISRVGLTESEWLRRGAQG